MTGRVSRKLYSVLTPRACSRWMSELWRVLIRLQSWRWWHPYVIAVSLLGCFSAALTFHRRTKLWARARNISSPLACDCWIEFHALWDRSIRLPSAAMSFRRRSKQPFLTWRSWSACTWSHSTVKSLSHLKFVRLRSCSWPYLSSFCLLLICSLQKKLLLLLPAILCWNAILCTLKKNSVGYIPSNRTTQWVLWTIPYDSCVSEDNLVISTSACVIDIGSYRATKWNMSKPTWVSGSFVWIPPSTWQQLSAMICSGKATPSCLTKRQYVTRISNTAGS